MANQELVMETTYGRKDKCKTEFKAVVNKVIVTGVIIATLMGGTITPALAATNNNAQMYGNSAITHVETGYNIENSIITIKNTIAAINEMRTNGSVNDEDLKLLANQLYTLEKSVSMNGGEVTPEIISVINEAEKSVAGLTGNGAEKVEIALAVVKSVLGIEDSVTLSDYKAGGEIGQSVSLSDIQGHWGEKAIKAMSQNGSIKGYEDGTFKPDKTISRSEFLAIAIRSTYPDYTPAQAGDNWWAGEYNKAIEKGIIAESEMPRSEMDAPIRREEMTMIMVRCVEGKGETLYGNATGVSRTLGDYYKTGEYYRSFLIKAYSNGLIAGKPGNLFDPQGSATRAEAATVLYRIENKSERVTPAYRPTGSGTTVVDVNAPITITEGAERTNRLAREGDTVIKADGSSVVLKKGPNGVLGEGQGVAPDLGFYYNVAGANPSRVVDGKMFTGGQLESWDNSIGSNVAGDFYYVHPLTGEGHWGNEWSVIAGASYDKLTDAGIVGKYEGEVSADKQSVWDATIEDWIPLYCNPEYVK